MLNVQRGGEQKNVKASLRAGAGLGGILPASPDAKMPFDIESMWDQASRMRKLQQRVDMLEQRLRELEKQLGVQKK